MKIYGLKEIMICTKDIEKSFLSNLTSKELVELIITSLEEESTTLYVYDEYQFSHNSKFNIDINYQEADTTPPVTKGFIRLVFWQELDNGEARIDCELAGNIILNLRGNTFGCMNDWGYETFNRIITNEGTELFLETESFGNEVINVCFLNFKKECLLSIEDIKFNNNLIEQWQNVNI